MMLPAVLLAYAGLTALCLAMDRHHRQVWERTPVARQRILLRSMGWTLLAASLMVCSYGFGWSIGLVIWCAALTAALAVLIPVMTYRNRLAPHAAAVAAVLACVLPFMT